MMILESPLTRTAVLVAAESWLGTLNALLSQGSAVPVTTRRLTARNCYFVLRHGGQYRSKWLVVRRTATERVAFESYQRRQRRSKWGGVAVVFILDHASDDPALQVQEFWCEPNRGRKYG
jgi:hypothetical protein